MKLAVLNVAVESAWLFLALCWFYKVILHKHFYCCHLLASKSHYIQAVKKQQMFNI